MRSIYATRTQLVGDNSSVDWFDMKTAFLSPRLRSIAIGREKEQAFSFLPSTYCLLLFHTHFSPGGFIFGAYYSLPYGKVAMDISDELSIFGTYGRELSSFERTYENVNSAGNDMVVARSLVSGITPTQYVNSLAAKAGIDPELCERLYKWRVSEVFLSTKNRFQYIFLQMKAWQPPESLNKCA